MKVLVTSASFQDTPGQHHQLLASLNYDVTFLKGPVNEPQLTSIIGGFDGMLCGDDNVTAEVLRAGKAGMLKYVSKYGVGVDNINVAEAKALQIPVTNCPGVNQVSVAEHVFALLLSFARNIHQQYAITRAGGWQKMTGFEISNKTIGIIGFGAVGWEVAKRAKVFGMKVLVATSHANEAVMGELGYQLAESINHLAQVADVITLHVPLNNQTRGLVNMAFVNCLKPGAVLINTARGSLVQTDALLAGLATGKIGGYLADVLEVEPMPADYPLKDLPGVLITSHIGSRTSESVQRQGVMAVENLANMIKGNIAGYKQHLV
jgi:D-3-phosphoglycerate dehydrogenase